MQQAAILYKNLKSIENIRDYLQSRKYVPDGVKGTLNFEPTFAVFVLRDGGDCSCFARIAQKLLRRAGYRPKMWLLRNGLDFEALHIITTIQSGLSYILFNVNQIMYFGSEEDIFKRFQNYVMVAVRGKPYIYDSLKV